MNSIAQPAPSRQPIQSTVKAVDYIDVSRDGQEYGLHVVVHVDARAFSEYDAYPSGSGMLTRECIISMLSYALHCDPTAKTVAVILGRSADDRPVEVTFNICRHPQDEQEQLHLKLAGETEL